MSEKWRIEQRTRADEHLAGFLAANPGYLVAREPPEWMLGTHLVIFGSFEGKPAVFKYYDGDPRKEHEKTALELFAPTGLVPTLFHETDVMLVMERLPGETMHDRERQLNLAEMHGLYSRCGEAVARVVETAPGSDVRSLREKRFRAAEERDFYNTPYDAPHELYRQAGTGTFFDTTLARANRVVQDRHVTRKEVLSRSLAALQRNRDTILSYVDFVPMDDSHTNNIMAEGTRITGFIDLEMTRYGNEVLLLGAALCAMCKRPGCWRSFRAGYEQARGKTMDSTVLSVVRSAAPFTRWIRFTWYCSTDDVPQWAVGMNLREGAVEDVAETVEAVEEMLL
jgi:hypothetical protein